MFSIYYSHSSLVGRTYASCVGFQRLAHLAYTFERTLRTCLQFLIAQTDADFACRDVDVYYVSIDNLAYIAARCGLR